MTKVNYVCKECKSYGILRDAYAEWNEVSQKWEILNTYDDYYCPNCDGDTKPLKVKI